MKELEPKLTYKMTIAYDGANYCGWQVQLTGLSIQEVIQNAIEKILHKKITVTGSGRTDTGVHALAQIAHFRLQEPIDPYRFQGSLNALLPKEIRIIKIEHAEKKFHARYSPIGKTYLYHLHLNKVRDPFKRLHSLHVKENIDLNLLEEATKVLIGRHDFTSFTNESHKGSASIDPIRTLKRITIVKEPGGIRLELEADGFLYRMVRNIVGTLLEVAKGKYSIKDLQNMLELKDRTKSGKGAPAHGLFLAEVYYPQNNPVS